MARQPTDKPGTLEEKCAALAADKLREAAELPMGAKRAQLEREAWELQNATALNDAILFGKKLLP